ncbi:MAG: Gfo/Idh/MocA family oxidoreductase [Lachnospiraceae bacterium]|jgi:predicted dehydrogenase|nr:Gfo/Idh/MocA family oxidoreductase [Lachnospiraceae bacterium]MCI1327986.1 Gfo/Idh/MocA family oxidoreductase [Lachnospiraceae bacterium]
MKKFRLGVIGLGDISNAYLTNLQKFPDEVELTGCACRSLEKAQRKAEQYGFRKAYASGDELLADPEIDIVLNLTIPETHYYYNLAAIKAGKHVYSEKPLAATFEEGKEIVDLAKEKGLYVGCAPDTFMGARLQTFRRLIDEGVTGKIIAGTANCVCHGWEWFHPNPAFFYQPGAGPVLDIGPYYFTALLSLLGPVESVCAMGCRPQDERMIYGGPKKGETVPVHPDVMTTLMAVLKFKNGAVVNANMSWDAWDSVLPRLELYGTKATLCIDEEDPNAGPNLFGGDTLYKTEKTYRWRSMPRNDAESAIPWETAEVQHDYDATSYVINNRGIGLVDTIRAIREGRANRASGDMALHMLEVCEGILVSARENRYIRMTSTFEIPAAMPKKR